MNGLRLAVTTFTVWPLKGPDTVDRRSAGSAMRLAPLVSLLVSVPAVVVLLGSWLLLAHPQHALDALQTPAPRYEIAPSVRYELASGLAATLAVAVTAALTRGLHLDGLADTVDGLGSYRTPEKALELMQRGGSGPLGVAALVLTLVVQVLGLAVVTDHSPALGAAVLVGGLAVSRVAVTLACTPRTPAARPDGLGAMVAGTVSRVQALGLTTVVVGAAGALMLLPRSFPVYPETGYFTYGGSYKEAGGVALPGGPRLFSLSSVPSAWSGAVVVLLVAVVALALSHVLRSHCVRRFGGMTGDVLGALAEVTTTVVLLGAALFVPALA